MLIVLYGKTGSGKSTIAKELARKYGYKLAVSVTSRNKRKGEKDGVHYWFKTKDEMFKMYYEDHTLAELNTYMDNYYGLPISEINDGIKIAVMEPDGMKALKEAGYDIIPIYINVSEDDQKVFLQHDYSRFPEETQARLEKGDSKFTDEVINMAASVIYNSTNSSIQVITNNVNNIIQEIISCINKED